MGRKRRLQDIILSMTLVSTLSLSCNQDVCTPAEGTQTSTTVSLEVPHYTTRSEAPEENAIKDVNLIIFENSSKEGHIWIRNGSAEPFLEIQVDLIEGHTYSLYAVANLGKKVEAASPEDIAGLSYTTEPSGNYDNGIPMTAYLKDITVQEGMRLDMKLTRCIAKVSLTLDRSNLSDDVSMTVKKVSVGNSPKFLQLFGTNRVINQFDRYATGYVIDQFQCAPLNRIGIGGKSESVSLYLPENMQGKFPGSIEEDEEKILDSDDPLSKICSYIEMEIDYSSRTLISYDSNLIYRFYLGDDVNSLDVERNCHYHITVTPEDDGLSGSGWRVDKTGIGPSTPTFAILPGDYMEGHVGDELQLFCDYYPRSAPFDPGYEELDFDKSRGIYDYKVDEAGRKVTLYLKKPGTGIVYMSAGYPVNKSGMVIVSVKP